MHYFCRILYGVYRPVLETDMTEIHRLTKAQAEAGESYLNGSHDRKAAILWSRARGRLRGEERWRALVDLSVREILLAGVENEDPYLLVDLAFEAVKRMEPMARFRLFGELQDPEDPRRLRRDLFPGVGVPLGTWPGRPGRWPRFVHPEITRLVGVLAKEGEKGMRFSDYLTKAADAGLSSRKATRRAESLDSGELARETRGVDPLWWLWLHWEGKFSGQHVETWIKRIRRKGPGRPKDVLWIRLTPQGSALAHVLRPVLLGPGGILSRPRI